ncbi:MAG: MATE family efflux transporter [Clostridia bacterium]|nr:MATE family efflux transporter [Clostridia bacterium]
MQRDKERDFTRGSILPALVRFALPILGALVLQAMYGAVDLLVVGKFAGSADVSGVSTGSQLMMSLTSIITGLSMGTTVLLGQRLGAGRREEAGDVVGTAVALFCVLAVALSALVLLFTDTLCTWMQAPQEAFGATRGYVRVCAAGLIFIAAYNVLGSIFRGLGDSRTPFLAVCIATVVNVAGDLLLVAGLRMGATGAALATVLSQALSVGICLPIIRKRGLPFSFTARQIRLEKQVVRQTLTIGTPIALQDLLVSFSFLAILSIVNGLGLTASAGVGVAEKLCGFIMLVPSAFMQALSAFVAQNVGASQHARARKAMGLGMALSFSIGLILASLAFFRGDLLCGLFTDEQDVIMAGWDYLKAYAIDTLLVSFFFCFNGFYNGYGRTRFVMIQGLIGAFCVRLPVSLLMSRIEPPSLFRIGLAVPMSSVVQIIMCSVYFVFLRRAQKAEGLG